MKKLLPILLLLIGLGAGAGAGWFLRPAPQETAEVQGDATDAHGETADAHGEAAEAHGDDGHGVAAPGTTETIRLPNQFVVPLIEEGQVRAMVVIGLALELNAGHSFVLANDEARLRSLFLQRLFDHANIGGFDGLFTSGEALLALRSALRDAARELIGPSVRDVLITELLRQES